MVDKIQKSLDKLSPKEKKWVREILEQISSGNLKGLNIKKLKGQKNIFRVRKGDIRIIYRNTSDSISVLAIERRSESTYKDF